MTADNAPAHVRRINFRPDPEKLAADLERLRVRSLELGASDAILLDREGIFLCPGPRLAQAPDKSRRSAHWPLTLPLDPVAEAIKNFSHAVLFRLPAPAAMPDYGQDLIDDPVHREIYRSLYAIVARIESEAFYMGHHLAVGFAAGNCKAVFCARERRCTATIPGRTCRHPYKARPSMAAAGFDLEAMAAHFGRVLKDGQDGPWLYGIVLVS